MKTIAFYISDHGFGHITRNISIIRSILGASNDIRIIVKCSEKHIQLMKSLLEDYSSRVEYYEENTDVGLILKEGSIEVDRVRLKQSYMNLFILGKKEQKKRKSFYNIIM